jgi:hypothetical protein
MIMVGGCPVSGTQSLESLRSWREMTVKSNIRDDWFCDIDARLGLGYSRLGGMFLLFAMLCLAAPSARSELSRQFDREVGHYAEITVTGPYLEFHTGPGKRYPVFHVVPRGEHVQILFRRTDWFKVRDNRDRQGWVHREQIDQSVLADGEPLTLEDPNHRDVDALPWIAGAESGRLGHGWSLAGFVGYSPTPKFTIQAEITHQPSQVSDRLMGLAGLVHTVRPDWRISPYLEAGGGISQTHANAGAVGVAAGRETVGYYGAGLRWEVNNRFEFRLHERSYLMSRLSRPNVPNEAKNEWKAGFAFYF